MFRILLPLALLFISCNSESIRSDTGLNTDSSVNDTVLAAPADVDTAHETLPETKIVDTSTTQTISDVKTYENKRFRNVRVEKIGANEYRISGQGQIFEASFGWVIEDGHNELKEGYTSTDAGAPEWGDFSFTITAPERDSGRTLHLILFETSAKDGSRQYELPLRLD